VNKFLRQSIGERISFAETVGMMKQLCQ